MRILQNCCICDETVNSSNGGMLVDSGVYKGQYVHASIKGPNDCGTKLVTLAQEAGEIMVDFISIKEVE